MNEIVKYETERGQVELTLDIVKNHLAIGKGFTDKEIFAFLHLCEYQKLNPFLNEAYLIKYGDTAQMIVGKDVFLKRAYKNDRFEGYEAGILIKKDNDIVERKGCVMNTGETLLGGYAKVYIRGWKIPLEHTVKFSEYDTRKSTWLKMPATMIRKVALVQALREAFPEDFQGLYDFSEMSSEEVWEEKQNKV